MNVVLTGAGGFTGRRFAELARARGHRVVALDADLTRPDAVRDALDAAVRSATQDDHPSWAVVHLAAVSFVAHADPLAFYRVNVLGTLHLLQALAGQRVAPACVLLASSANVYGNNPHSPIAEDQPPAPVNHYGASKLAMEHLARSHGAGLPLVLTRPFNYTGPGQAGQFVIPKLVSHFARRASVVELGNLHVEREYNDIDFVCESYLLLLAHARPGATYNVCTGVTHTLGDVIECLRRLTGHVLEVRTNPQFVRPDEIARLCGDPSRLRAVWRQAGRQWPAPQLLESTLARMLAASC